MIQASIHRTFFRGFFTKRDLYICKGSVERVKVAVARRTGQIRTIDLAPRQTPTPHQGLQRALESDFGFAAVGLHKQQGGADKDIGLCCLCGVLQIRDTCLWVSSLGRVGLLQRSTGS